VISIKLSSTIRKFGMMSPPETILQSARKDLREAEDKKSDILGKTDRKNRKSDMRQGREAKKDKILWIVITAVNS
jgi:hypothetical protein